MKFDARLKRLERIAAQPVDIDRRNVESLSDEELTEIAGPLTEADFIEICDELRTRERGGLTGRTALA
jgi:hypothetical protein